MKKTALLLALALCLSLCACNSNNANSNDVTSSVSIPSVSIPPTTTTQARPSLNYTLEDVIIAKAVEMAALTGLRTNRDFLKLYISYDDIINLAQTFSVAATEDPIQAFALCVGDADITGLINSITSRMGDRAVGCTNVLTHSTQMKLPESLSDAIAVCLKYNADCNILVTFTPVQEQIVFVQSYAIFSEVAEELLNSAPKMVSI